MYSFIFILMAIALFAAIKQWHKLSLISFTITFVLVVIMFIPHTIRVINISL